MARTKVKATPFGVPNEIVELTEEQETARDAEESAHAAGQSDREFLSLRLERDKLLSESDWTQYIDSPLDDQAKTEWATHRQLLRDLPATEADPAAPTWPTPPSVV
jgi:hypothetical protein